MITINNVNYNNRKILLPNLFEGEILELSSDSSVVTWSIVKYPQTQDDQQAYFNISNDNPSTFNNEQLTLELVGTYYLKAVERDSNGNYRESKIYIRSNSMITHTSLPFSGEKNEINERGWGEELLEYIVQLTNLITPLVLVNIDGGGSTYNGNENLLDGGDAICIFGATIDGGTASDQLTMIDGGNA